MGRCVHLYKIKIKKHHKPADRSVQLQSNQSFLLDISSVFAFDFTSERYKTRPCSEKERILLIAILAFQYSLSLCTSQTWFPVRSFQLRCDLDARRVSFFFLPLNSSLVVYNPAEARHKKRPFRHQSLSSSVPFFSSFHLFWNKNFLNFFFFLF